MRNKLFSLILAICLIVPSMFALTACSIHKCIAKEDWKTDGTYHWHECQDPTCSMVVNQDYHCWDNGVVTTEATYLANGEKTYTCQVCNQTKTETIYYDRAITSQWHTALGFIGVSNVNFEIQYDNCKYSYKYGNGIVYICIVYNDGGTREKYYTKEYGEYYFYYNNHNTMWYKDDFNQDGYNDMLPTGELAQFAELSISDFTFDAQTEKYVAESAYFGNKEYTNVQIGFEDGKFISFRGQYDGVEYTATITYETVNLTIPTDWEWHMPE